VGRIGGAGAPSGPMPTPKGMSFGQTNGVLQVKVPAAQKAVSTCRECLCVSATGVIDFFSFPEFFQQVCLDAPDLVCPPCASHKRN